MRPRADAARVEWIARFHLTPLGICLFGKLGKSANRIVCVIRYDSRPAPSVPSIVFLGDVLSSSKLEPHVLWKSMQALSCLVRSRIISVYDEKRLSKHCTTGFSLCRHAAQTNSITLHVAYIGRYSGYIFIIYIYAFICLHKNYMFIYCI